MNVSLYTDKGVKLKGETSKLQANFTTATYQLPRCKDTI